MCLPPTTPPLTFCSAIILVIILCDPNEREKILPINCVTRLSDAAQFQTYYNGRWLLELMEPSISAAVNSDNIEDSDFQLERCILLLSSLPPWLHCNILSLW